TNAQIRLRRKSKVRDERHEHATNHSNAGSSTANRGCAWERQCYSSKSCSHGPHKTAIEHGCSDSCVGEGLRDRFVCAWLLLPTVRRNCLSICFATGHF